MDKLILLVDDAMFIRMTAKRALNKYGLTNIEEAETKEEALEKFHTLHPDLVILDITLPDNVDLTLCQELLESDRNAKIIIYSAITQDLAIEKAKDMGVFDYITKPFDEEYFIRQVKAALGV